MSDPAWSEAARSEAARSEAARIIGEPGSGPLVIICEHACNHVPTPLTVSARDRPWLDTHWGIDIGAAEVSRQVLAATGGVGVLSQFCRLVCDPNRAPADPTLILPRVEDHPLSFNQGLTAAERQRRIDTFHTPYHQAVEATIEAHGDRPLLISMHSFTPVWRGRRRQLDVGVLFEDCEEASRALAGRLANLDLLTQLNEPYSAMNGMAYSVTRHGRRFGLEHIELEINQRLLGTPDGIARISALVAEALEPLLLGR